MRTWRGAMGCEVPLADGSQQFEGLLCSSSLVGTRLLGADAKDVHGLGRRELAPAPDKRAPGDKGPRNHPIRAQHTVQMVNLRAGECVTCPEVK
jgi:hypothetical protein